MSYPTTQTSRYLYLKKKKKKSWCIQIVFFLNTHPNKNLYSKNVVIKAMLTKLSKNPFLRIL